MNPQRKCPNCGSVEYTHESASLVLRCKHCDTTFQDPLRSSPFEIKVELQCVLPAPAKPPAVKQGIESANTGPRVEYVAHRGPRSFFVLLLLFAILLGAAAFVYWISVQRQSLRLEESGRAANAQSTERALLALNQARSLDAQGKADEALTLTESAINREPGADPHVRAQLEELARTLVERATKEQNAALNGLMDSALESLKKRDVRAAIETLTHAERLTRAARYKVAMALKNDCREALSKERLAVAIAEMSEKDFEAYVKGGAPSAGPYFENADLNSLFVDRIAASRAHASELLALGIRTLDSAITQGRPGMGISEGLLRSVAKIPPDTGPEVVRRKGFLTEYKWLLPSGEGLALKGAFTEDVHEATLWLNLNRQSGHKGFDETCSRLGALFQALSKEKLSFADINQLCLDVIQKQTHEQLFTRAKWSSRWTVPRQGGVLVIDLTQYRR